MDPRDATDDRAPTTAGDSPKEQLRELARLVGGLLAREWLRRPTADGRACPCTRQDKDAKM